MASRADVDLESGDHAGSRFPDHRAFILVPGTVVGLKPMLRIVNKEQALPLDIGSGLLLIGSETSVIGGWRYFAAGASYTRPKSIEVPGRESLRVWDHLMITRLAMVVLVLMLTLWRLLDGRRQ